MAETLYIRLGSQVQDEISWLIFNTVEQEIIASGELTNAEQLSDLTEKAQQRLVKVFVPGCDVSLKRLTVPTKSQRAMRSAVPYMLEDELGQDVDQLFFAYANLNSDEEKHNCFVAVTERAQMLQWQTWLTDANIQAKTLQPDILAMPYTPQQWSAIAFNGSSVASQIIVRQGEWQGFILESDAWKFALSHTFPAVDDEQDGIIINAYSDLPTLDDTVNHNGFTFVKAEEELPLALLAQNCHHSSFNLLQGEFKVKEKRSIHLTNWLWVAGIAVCALLLNVGYKSAYLWQLSAEQTQVEAQIVSQYKKAFPNAKKVRIGIIKSQLSQKLAQLGGTDGQAGFLAMLTEVQPAFAKVPGLKPESLKFDGKRQELRVQAIADDYQHFERFKNALSTANLTVKQGAQNNQGDKVTGSFSVVNKPATQTSKERS